MLKILGVTIQNVITFAGVCPVLVLPDMSTEGSRFTTEVHSRIFGCKSNHHKMSGLS